MSTSYWKENICKIDFKLIFYQILRVQADDDQTNLKFESSRRWSHYFIYRKCELGKDEDEQKKDFLQEKSQF